MDADSHNRTTLLKRQDKLANLFDRAGLHALVLNAGPSLVYLTGLHFHLSERPVLAIFTPGAPVALVLPELEAAKTKGLPYPANIYLYGEDPAGWLSIFHRAAIETQLDKHIIGADPRQLRLLELGCLQAAAPIAEFVSAEELLAKLRMYKDATELTAMRKAAQIAQLALISTLPLVRIGMLQKERMHSSPFRANWNAGSRHSSPALIPAPCAGPDEAVGSRSRRARPPWPAQAGLVAANRERHQEVTLVVRHAQSEVALFVPGMSLVDLAEGIVEKDLLGRCDAVLQLRFAPVRLVPLEALQTPQDQPHAASVAADRT